MTSTPPTVSPTPTLTAGAIFGATPGMPGVFTSNFDYQLVRAMCAGSYGDGGAVGECFSTARRVVDGDIESWTVAWSDTAQRVEAIAEDCLGAGHTVSAREAFLRASMYWNTAFFYLEHTDPRQLEMYGRHRSCFIQAATLFDTPIEPVSIPYFAPRAAAYEKRITAVVANSLAPELKPILMLMANLDPDVPAGEDFDDKADLANPLTKMFATNFKDRLGMAGQSLGAFCDNLGAYSLAGLEEHITCPLLNFAGEGEGSQMMSAGHAFYEKLTCPKAERVVLSVEGGEAHCQMNNPSLKHQVEFDWLGEIFK